MNVSKEGRGIIALPWLTDSGGVSIKMESKKA